jgi:hypothetical protein
MGLSTTTNLNEKLKAFNAAYTITITDQQNFDGQIKSEIISAVTAALHQIGQLKIRRLGSNRTQVLLNSSELKNFAELSQVFFSKADINYQEAKKILDSMSSAESAISRLMPTESNEIIAKFQQATQNIFSHERLKETPKIGGIDVILKLNYEQRVRDNLYFLQQELKTKKSLKIATAAIITASTALLLLGFVVLSFTKAIGFLPLILGISGFVFAYLFFRESAQKINSTIIFLNSQINNSNIKIEQLKAIINRVDDPKFQSFVRNKNFTEKEFDDSLAEFMLFNKLCDREKERDKLSRNQENNSDRLNYLQKEISKLKAELNI